MNEYIENKKWISCGVNLDEDLHFSTTYLRMSLTTNIGHIFKGYSSFVAIYENFNEEYYLEESECISVSKELIEKIKADPYWFEEILHNIVLKTNLLKTVFDENIISKNYLSRQDNKNLKALYQSQLNASLDLYQYARVPEVLDRGVNYFTNYLIDYLKKQLNKDDVYDEFLMLTSTKERSIFQTADDELIEIINCIPSEILKSSSLRNLRLRLPNIAKEKIDTYLKKWKYLEYHGYGAKKLLNADDILKRILNYRDFPETEPNQLYIEQKEKIIRQANISSEMLILFNFYPKIAITKLYRKYFQIRNFYYLDLIIEEIAKRINENEAFVRCMLPEEILSYLDEGEIKKLNIEARVDKCVYASFHNKEYIETEKNVISSIKKMLCDTQYENQHKIIGYPVSKGYIIGNSTIINRKEDAVYFNKGDIIISDSADPDIFDIIKSAGAVLTEQGGATSHVALYCRELGIPAIVGVKGITNITPGTILEVDAYNGKVNILYHKSNNDLKFIGPKATNLFLLRENNFIVPNFSILNFLDIKECVDNDKADELLFKIISCGLLFDDTKKYIFRSSAVDEDTLQSSNVGKFTSIANISKKNLTNGAKEFVNENSKKNYRGSIIVQEMLPFEYCGVAVTGDNKLNSNNYVTIEICEGEQNKITEGVGTIARIVYDKIRDEIKEIVNRDLISGLEPIKLINQFLRIEKIWGQPMDIEWGVFNDTLYILQARPIVKNGLG